jgi:hypothetical protein
MLPEAKKYRDLKNKAIETLHEMREQRNAFNPTLRVPHKGRHSVGINIKNVKTCFGTIESKDLENAWSQLCTFGEEQNWSHKDYKLALKMTLASDLQRYYTGIQDRSLRFILASFTSRYITETMTTKLSQLIDFKRMKYETLQCAMERFKTILLLTEASVPVGERIQRNNDEMKRTLDAICSAQAKSAIASAKAHARTKGSYATYESLRDTAILTEESNKYTPNEDLPLAQTAFATQIERPYPNRERGQRNNFRRKPFNRDQNNRRPQINENNNQIPMETQDNTGRNQQNYPQNPEKQENVNPDRNRERKQFSSAKKPRYNDFQQNQGQFTNPNWSNQFNQRRQNQRGQNQNNGPNNQNQWKKQFSGNPENQNRQNQGQQRQNPPWRNQRSNRQWNQENLGSNWPWRNQGPNQRWNKDNNWQNQNRNTQNRPISPEQRRKNQLTWQNQPQSGKQAPQRRYYNNNNNGYRNNNNQIFQRQNNGQNWNQRRQRPTIQLCTHGHDVQMCNILCSEMCPQRQYRKNYLDNKQTNNQNENQARMPHPSEEPMDPKKAQKVLSALMAAHEGY